MLCARATRNVVKKPNKKCWLIPDRSEIRKPITAVATKQMIETNEAVSSARTMIVRISSPRGGLKLDLWICALPVQRAAVSRPHERNLGPYYHFHFGKNRGTRRQ